MPTTAQQANTLLHYLSTQQQPPFAILFWSALQKIDFDNTPNSLNKISQLFTKLGQRGVDLAKILSQQGGDTFLLAIASYLGSYLAASTGETLTWYDYSEISQEIAEQNRRHHTAFALPHTFASSLVAKVGEVYCQPLQLFDNLLKGEPVLAEFMADMQRAIFAKRQVNLLGEPNVVAKDYLGKIETTKLLDKSILFYPYLSDITFDFSQSSLSQIDQALTAIAQHENFSTADYARIISEPAGQALVYLLGFYIGATSSHLAHVPSKWANFDEMAAMMGADFVNCIEHRFVQLMENHYRTPMLVVTNRLFGIAPNFPDSAVTFANMIAEQNGSMLHIFPLQNTQSPHVDTPLPPIVAQAVDTAGQLLSHQLALVLEQKPLVPKLIQVDSQSQQTATLSSLDTDTALDKLYRQLGESNGLRYQVASFGLLTNLPLGQLDAIALEIRVNQLDEHESVALQLLLPYRIDKANHLPTAANLVLYPVISNQPNLPTRAYQIVKALYQHLPSKILQACLVNELTPWAISPLQHATVQKRQQEDNQLIDNISLKCLPLAQNVSETLPSVGLDLAVPPFDYAQLTWRGFDLPKYVLDTPEAQREYLQVVVPDRLINDELFSQAQSLQRLYRYGKVVWGVVVRADDALYQLDTSVADTLSPSELLTADILYDPTGQASVEQLTQASEQLQRILSQPIDQLPPDQALYVSHIQDGRSRVFALAYPQSLQRTTFKISSVWVWRRHLPNGVLQDIVPVMVEPDNPSQPDTAKGRIMLLPSRFWQTDFYQYWLADTRQRLKLADTHDLMPAIVWQEQQGFRYVGKGMDARLFPKFKFNTTVAKAIMSETKPVQPVTSVPKKATAPIEPATATPAMITEPPAAVPTSMQPNVGEKSVAKVAVMPSMVSPVVASEQSPSDKLTALTPELQQQLLQQRARLQAELSTTDTAKQQKLYLIIGILVAVIVMGLLVAKVMGR